jgi:hypothetical protein
MGAGGIGGSLGLELENSLAGETAAFKGIVGEARSVVEIENQFGTVIGRNVSFVGPTGQRSIIDIVWVDADGVLRGTEAKFGQYADLTKPQSIVIGQGGYLALTPVGGNALATGVLQPGVTVGIFVDIARWLF